jgi:hypothetical protein
VNGVKAEIALQIGESSVRHDGSSWFGLLSVGSMVEFAYNDLIAELLYVQ